MHKKDDDEEIVDYSKLPWYWRKFRMFQKKWCKMGMHVPVKSGNEYFCQECLITLTKEDWIEFFRKSKERA